jgi:hypothetical protein
MDIMIRFKNNNSGFETIKSPKVPFFQRLCKKMRYFSQKYFGILKNGHFFCPFSESPWGLLQKNAICDHNEFLWCRAFKKFYFFVTILFKIVEKVQIFLAAYFRGWKQNGNKKSQGFLTKKTVMMYRHNQRKYIKIN